MDNFVYRLVVFFLLSAFCFLLSAFTRADDIIYLKDGVSFVGKVLEETEEEIKVKTDLETITLPREEVAKIGYNKAPVAKKARPDQIIPWEVYFKQGMAYKKASHFKEAIIQFEKVVKAEPDNWQSLLELGICRAELKQYPQASKEFKKVVFLRPGWPNGYYYLASCYYHSGEVKEGIKLAKTAILLEPDLAAPHYVLGLLLEKEKQVNPAIKEYRWAKALAEDLATREMAERKLNNLLSNHQPSSKK